MSRYFTLRIMKSIPTIAGAATLIFFFIHLVPGNPVDLLLGESAPISSKQALKERLGLNRPLSKQYISFVAQISTGNLGYSISKSKSVTSLILERLPYTFFLAAVAILFTVILGSFLGLLGVLFKNRLPDHMSFLFSLVVYSMPNFFLGPLLMIIFSVHLNLFPLSGFEGLSSVFLPAITLSLGLSATFSRITRESFLKELDAPYTLFARAKGLTLRTILLRHIVKNASLPIITIVGLEMGSLLAGSVVTETIFSWPGIGKLLMEAILARDYPLVQGVTLFIASSYVLLNIFTDLLYAFVDPRVRISFEKQ